MSSPRGRDDVILRPIGRDWILYDSRTRDVHLLNVAAALTWDLLDGTTDVEGIARKVAELMQDPPALEVVERDVAEAVASFREKGLLA